MSVPSIGDYRPQPQPLMSYIACSGFDLSVNGYSSSKCEIIC